MTNPDDDSLNAAATEAVALYAHRAEWQTRYENGRERLIALLGDDILAIAHIGSTAVPGLLAKPIIDIMVGVISMPHADALVEPLCDAGYIAFADINARLTDRRWLMRQHDGHRTHHLHLVVDDSAAWHRHLCFRDALRDDPGLKQRYSAHKQRLAARYHQDRDAYTHAKSAFIASALD